MREIFVVVALAGCGRIAFDPRSDASGDGGDATVLDGCVAQVAANGDQTCVRRFDGHVWCWGDSTQGNLGNGMTGTQQQTPTPSLMLDAATLASGEDTVCAIRTNGELACWGAGDAGQIGDGGMVDRNLPTRVALPAAVAAVAAAQFHTCARLVDGTGYCWGDNPYGELGKPASGVDPLPVLAPIGDATQLALGDNLTCKLLATQVAQCWGQNTAGETGDGQLTAHSTPATVQIPDPVLQIAAGCHRHACAVTTLGDVWCWGENLDMQVGTGVASASEPVPHKVPLDGLMIVEVAVGVASSCARTADHEVYCWGSNMQGELGNGTFTQSQVPTRVSGVTGTLRALEGSCSNMYVVRDDASLLAWGLGEQLGTVSDSNSAVAVEVTVPCD